MKHLAIAAAILFCGVAASGEIHMVPGAPGEPGLEFTVEAASVEPVLGNLAITIQGTVENTADTTFKMVKVVFVVKDGNGNFITRNDAFCDPVDIGVDEDSHVSHTFLVRGKTPGIIEYSVTGTPGGYGDGNAHGDRRERPERRGNR